MPFSDLINLKTKTLLSPESVASAFSAEGVTANIRILNCCGGGIAATLDAFLQHHLGYRSIAVYDAPMSEWARDEALPIEVDPVQAS